MKIKYIFQTLIITLIVLSAFSCGFLSMKHEKKENVEYKLNTHNKTKISFKNVSGNFTVSRSDSITGLVIKAEKVGYVTKKDLDKPLDNIKINIDTSAEIIEITSELKKEKGWIHFDIHKDEVNYNILIPPGIAISVENINGDVELNNIPNESNIVLTNGKIKINNISGRHNFSIINGCVNGSIDSIKSLRMDLVNGCVNLVIGKKFEGEIYTTIVNGKINYEDLQLSDVSSDKKTLRGYIVNKENEIWIKAVNGKINFSGNSKAKTFDE